MLRLLRVAPHQWKFVYPNLYYDLIDEFQLGCNFYEEGNLNEAERVFKAVLVQMPDHLDAIHHLAMVLLDRCLYEQACDLWEQSERIARKAFPQDFERGNDRLEWVWLENRPFLRCLHGLSLVRYEGGRVKDALMLFQELLSLNPNDNQGIRARAQMTLFELGRSYV